MSIRFMLDSDDLAALTDHAGIIATYSDLTSDPKAIEQAHPKSLVVWIDRGLGDPNNKATIMDIERFALTPADAPRLYDQWHAEGRQYITSYVNRSNIGAVDAAMGARQFWRWVATLDGTVDISGDRPLFAPAAVQCFTATMLGLHGDGSLVLEDAWHPQPTPFAAQLALRDVNGAISECALLANQLHQVAVVLGG